jgi:cyclic pyranopterin phosphate synthase
LRDKALPKGDVLTVAKIAAIQAAKRTDELIPLCHSLPVDAVDVEFVIEDDGIVIKASASTSRRPGVEMEALTAVSVAALTIYDMCKAVDKGMRIEAIRVTEKIKE